MDEELAVAQAMRYAEELQLLHARDLAARKAAEQSLRELEASYKTTVRALAAALELRDDVTGGHATRVAELALELAREVAPGLAAEPELEYAFLLHDLGKIGVPDAILRKPGPLDPDERAQMCEHPALGASIVEGIPYLYGLTHDVVVAHHEHWDGGGYPLGLSREAIPLAARIFAVVDAFDAMTNDRPYRRALTVDAALAELETSSGTQFDPTVVRAFVSLNRELDSAA